METHSDEYMGLACCVERHDDCTVLHLFGTLDEETIPAMRRVVSSARTKDDRALIIDLDGVTTAEGVNVDDALHHLHGGGLPLALVCRPGRHDGLLSGRVTVLPSVEEARHVLSRRRRGRLFSRLML